LEVQAKPAANGLRQLRQERGLTLQAVSVLSGITAAEASMLERGLIQPRPETIVKLARALGVGAYRMRDILTAPPNAEPELAGAEP
jgi:transcriptional regulator with XRE-family HTH domain